MNKRFLSLILAMVLVLSALPTAALAADVVASGTCGENLTWELTSDGVLTIAGTGEMYDYFLSPWYDYADLIVTVVIEAGITSIGSRCFAETQNLSTVTIPNSVTEIGEAAFAGCKGLTNIEIPSSVILLQDGAFSSSGLTSISVPDGITMIEDRTFSGCSNLTQVNLPDGITQIGKYAFANCVSLGNVDVPNTVQIIDVEAFSGCKNLNGIGIPFGVITISSRAFYGCTGMNTVILPNSISSIGSQAFYGCSGLKTVSIPDSVAVIEARAFGACTGLKSINVDENNPNYQSEVGSLFNKEHTTLLQVPGASEGKYVVTSGIASIGEYAFDGCSNLTSVVISEGVTRIGEGAFFKCSNLSSVTISDCVTTIESDAFAYCDSLPTIDIPESMTKIDGLAFSDWTGLTHIIIPNNITSIGYGAFSYCINLAEITIPESVIEIGDNAFVNCSNLLTINVDEDNTNYSSCDGALYDKGVTTLFQVPGGISGQFTIPDGVVGVYGNAFLNCNNLTVIEIPASVTDLSCDDWWSYIGSNFVTCTALMAIKVDEDNANYSSRDGILYNKDQSVLIQAPGAISGECTIPDSVTDIRSGAFFKCNKLTGIVIPNSVLEIGADAFGNTGLTSITIPESVTFVGQTAFSHCPDLTCIVFKGNAPAHGGHIFAGVTALAYYPIDNNTWTDTAFKELGESGTLTWVAGLPEDSPTENFSDVSDTDYFYAPVLWAYTNNITTGTTSTTFSPNNACTRAQIVTFLWRAMGEPEPQSNTTPFTDLNKNEYYYKAVLWAVEEGITTGMSATTFEPNRACTRSQAVTFQWRAAGCPTSSANNPFADIPAGQWYTEAVLWAVEQGITTGMSADKFAPNNTCTRAHIVTFLYRNLSEN